MGDKKLTAQERFDARRAAKQDEHRSILGLFWRRSREASMTVLNNPGYPDDRFMGARDQGELNHLSNRAQTIQEQMAEAAERQRQGSGGGETGRG